MMEFRVIRVEERFERAIVDSSAYGDAKSEAKAMDATQEVSTGWWIILEGWPIAIGVGREKPDLSAGDIMVLRKR